jgi:hypothetical protein
METNMARIAGVNIPTNKRVVIALQYIHGIGAKFAQEIVEKNNIRCEPASNELSDAEVLQIRETIDRDYQVEGDLAPRDCDEHQASDGPWLLPRPASSPRPAGSWSADAHQCTYPQGSGKGDRRQEESKIALRSGGGAASASR